MNYFSKIFKDQKIVTRFYTGYSIVAMLGIIILSVCIYGISILSGLVDKMYNYPLLVSNSALKAQTVILQIRNDMMEIASTNITRADTEAFISKIEHYKEEVTKYFIIIEDKIGDEKEKYIILQAIENFDDWKLIIDEVVDLIKNKSSSQAISREAISIMKNWNKMHVNKLTSLMVSVCKNTDKLAKNFHITAKSTNYYVITITIIITLVLGLMVLITSFFIAKNIKTSVRSAVETIKDITENGDLSKDVTVKSKDEMYEIATHINEFLISLRGLREQAKLISEGNLDNEVLSSIISGDLGDEFSKMVYNLKLLASQAKAISEGDLKNMILDNRINGDLGDAFFVMKENLKRIIGYIYNSAEITSNTSNEIAAQSEEIAGNAAMQVDMITHISTSVRQLTTSINQVADNAGTVSIKANDNTRIAENAKSLTEQASKMIKSTKEISARINETFKELQGKAENISEIINIIENIADKSDLLALNASIEATSAGEAGRRFSVVAGEMRKLSERISRSTGEIEAILKEIQNSIKDSAILINTEADDIENTNNIIVEVDSVFKGLYRDFSDTAIMMQDVSKATDEQRTTTESLIRSVEEIDASISETSNGAQDSAKATEQLAEISNRLIESVQMFNVESGEISKTKN